MTKAQRRILGEIDKIGEILGNDLNDKTRQALVGLGLIEECERMYFGPREWRYRLTLHGRQTLAAQKPASPTRYEREPL